ncbi:Aste57867_24337 [Aphanomyces stellatus]|uniref:Aste57867_24337 protein n=1 Tax=Aphanomyces stellatus TaxID=120398 RepID=A0A485LQ39_9STRA|nr:hypothetical protein As57867_024262 [Aphanomyces stellatus]VFU00977.1 Aste57867_24337 [Aphanomyces stellatus]
MSRQLALHPHFSATARGGIAHNDVADEIMTQPDVRHPQLPSRISIQLPMSPPSNCIPPVSPYSAASGAATMPRDPSSTKKCPCCHDSFSIFKRRYECPYCSEIVCRKCSRSMKKVVHGAGDDDGDHARLSSPLSRSNSSSSAAAADFDDTASRASTSSNVSSSSGGSPSRRRLKSRCCVNCAAFSTLTKPPSKCEICHGGSLRKKHKCHVCQKFACVKGACSVHRDGAPFGADSGTKAWVCTVCSDAHDADAIRSQKMCHLCKAPFAEFQRRCRCKSCGTTTCVQCSVKADAVVPGELKALDARECRDCVQKRHDASVPPAPPGSNTTFRLKSRFQDQDGSLSIVSLLPPAADRTWGGLVLGVGAVAAVLLVYFYFVSSVVEESWIAHWYPRPADEL